MCGIFGGLARHSFPAREHIVAALNALSHRGPDASGVVCHPPAFLAHRRLSIIDVGARSNQPMQVGPLAICFNGEIYNFKSIREALVKQHGVSFNTQSDTEVIAQAFLLGGAACLQQFEGMFAFAIWDERTRKLTLARDKFGEKPLYYYMDSEHLCFASEIPAIERYLGRDRLQVDMDAIQRYFLLTYIPAPASPYKNMFQLMPGEYLEFDTASWTSQTRTYYEPSVTHKNWTVPEAVEALREILNDSVALRAKTADVPVATFLSGGVDSSIVSLLALEAIPAGVRAYSIGFSEDPDFDESHYARLVASHHPRLQHVVIDATENQLLDFADKTLSMLGEPYADASLIPTAYLCAHVEEKVILGGDAADELFAGYGVYAAMRASAALPSWLKRILLRVPAIPNPTAIRMPLLRALALFHSHLRTSPSAEYISWRSYSTLNELSKLGLHRVSEHNNDLAGLKLGSLTEILAADIRFNLPNDMLKKVDLASMQYGKEIRLPFLDSNLVAFALSLPEHCLLGAGERKHVLRAAYRDRLPEVIFKRRKQGFLLPIRKWFKQGKIRDRLMDMAGQSSELDSRRIRQLLMEHESGTRDHSVLLWSILVYLVWRARVQT